MILELDAGNSRIKWRLLDGQGQLADRGALASAADLEQIGLQADALEMIRASSVRSEAENRLMTDWAAAVGPGCVFARVEKRWGPVQIQYADPGRLGVDRWLAMVAAYMRRNAACLVVDAGTALTIDAVDGGGLHRGGYILPGLAVMRSSLEQHTAIRLDPVHALNSAALANSTDDAVFNGANAAVLGAIRLALGELADERPTLYLAGGDAARIRELLGDIDTELAEDLVFEGLGLVCPADPAD